MSDLKLYVSRHSSQAYGGQPVYSVLYNSQAMTASYLDPKRVASALKTLRATDKELAKEEIGYWDGDKNQWVDRFQEFPIVEAIGPRKDLKVGDKVKGSMGVDAGKIGIITGFSSPNHLGYRDVYIKREDGKEWSTLEFNLRKLGANGDEDASVNSLGVIPIGGLKRKGEKMSKAKELLLILKESGLDEESGSYAVRTKFEMKNAVIGKIKELDPQAKFDPESNPVTFWVKTELSIPDIKAIEGVVEVVISVGGRFGNESADEPKIYTINDPDGEEWGVEIIDGTHARMKWVKGGERWGTPLHFQQMSDWSMNALKKLGLVQGNFFKECDEEPNESAPSMVVELAEQGIKEALDSGLTKPHDMALMAITKIEKGGFKIIRSSR